LQFWWPFPIKPLRRAANAAPLAAAQAELAAAEAALDTARTLYLRLQESHQQAKLRAQQIALDRALDRYLVARQSVRVLQREDAAGPVWARAAARRSTAALSLTRG
jgi:hypothetical protein